MPRVLNKNTDVIPPDAVFVGRPSKWGNPFVIGVHGARDEVIEKYKRMMARVPHEIIQKHLRGKDLVCFCAPRPCHADWLLEIANADPDK